RKATSREAQLLSRMQHSNIVNYVESFSNNRILHIVMGYADGGDLAQAIECQRRVSKPFAEEEVMRIFVQLCLALRHVHSHKILHRDLKSQNVFLTKAGVVKLGDFGIAKLLDSSEACARTQIGTPYYLSPELCQDKPYGRSSDVWALGILLYELLALKVPFQARNLAALVGKITTQEPPPIEGCRKSYSEEVLALMSSILRKEPSERPTVNEVTHELLLLLLVLRYSNFKKMIIVAHIPFSLPPPPPPPPPLLLRPPP
ncbi:unnamed protein product, partial [Choristocarpus tenellus]